MACSGGNPFAAGTPASSGPRCCARHEISSLEVHLSWPGGVLDGLERASSRHDINQPGARERAHLQAFGEEWWPITITRSRRRSGTGGDGDVTVQSRRLGLGGSQPMTIFFSLKSDTTYLWEVEVMSAHTFGGYFGAKVRASPYEASEANTSCARH